MFFHNRGYREPSLCQTSCGGDRLVWTERVRLQGVAGRGVGTGPRTSANDFEFAPPALTLQRPDVAKAPERRRLAVHGNGIIVTDVSGRDGQETRRVDIAAM